MHAAAPPGSTPCSYADDLNLDGITTARGKTFPLPSDASMKAAKSRMEAWQRDDDRAIKQRPGPTAFPKTQLQRQCSTGVLSPSTRPQSPSTRSLAAQSPSFYRASSSSRSLTGFCPPSQTSSTSAPSHRGTRNVGSAPPCRKRDASDLLSIASTPTRRSQASLPASDNGSAMQLITPRNSVSMRQPASVGSGTKRKKFKTPFKEGMDLVSSGSSNFSRRPCKPGDVPHEDPSGTSGIFTQQAYHSSRKAPCPRLFNCNPQLVPNRISLLQSGFYPEEFSQMQAAQGGCPDEAFTVLNTPWMANDFAFLPEAHRAVGPEEALRILHSKGGASASLKWVKHHWGLILWKLAAMARHEPSRAEKWWSWATALSQLQYRYERETNMGQRSTLNRIIQHDSSAAQPMVLCVYKLELGLPFPDPEHDDTSIEGPGRNDTAPQPLIVLTDGWYTIRAYFDDTLLLAVRRGRIRVGHKLQILGAKCEGGPTGALEGFSTVSLHLHANGTQLASWDSKLGSRRSPWVSSLRSLSPEGGKVSLVRIRITQVFNMGYLDANAKQRGQVHSASEEAELQSKWEKERFETSEQLEQIWTDKLARSQEAVQAIESMLPEYPKEEGNDKEESTLDHLFDSPDPLVALHRLCPGGKGVTLSLLQCAQSRLQAQKEEASHECLGEMDERVPPRRVRTFRVIKCQDAIPLVPLPEHVPPGRECLNIRQAVKARSSLRTAQVTVWDAANLEGTLRKGECFLVTNLYPSAPGSWRGPDEDAEVFLQTRQGSMWIPISDPDPNSR